MDIWEIEYAGPEVHDFVDWVLALTGADGGCCK